VISKLTLKKEFEFWLCGEIEDEAVSHFHACCHENLKSQCVVGLFFYLKAYTYVLKMALESLKHAF
jgi:hypothetical protein